MADPFGITQVALTSLKLAKILHGIVVDLQNCPSEILALSNEVCNLKFVLDSAQEFLRHDHDGSLDKLGPLLFHSRVKMDQLENMLGRWTRTKSSNGSLVMKKWDRVLWLKEKEKAWDLQKQFKELRSNISVLMEASTLSITTRLSVDVEKLYSNTTRLYSAQSNSLDAISDKVSPIEDIHRSAKETVLLLKNLQDSVSGLVQQRRLSDATTAVAEPTLSKQAVSPSENDASSTTSSATERAETAVVAVPVFRQTTGRPKCWPECTCRCHLQKHSWTSLPIIKRLVGSLFVGYSGATAYWGTCNVSTCDSRQQVAQITYFFPRWWLSKVLSVSFSTRIGSPNFNIKIRRPVSEASRLFALSRCEGVAGIRQMFSERTASPDDIDIRGGWSPLHHAVDHGCVEVCKLLIQEGADPHWEDNTGTSPVEKAWRNILHLKANPQLADAYKILFPGTEYIQERRFSQLHRIIIGMDESNLEASLVRSKPNINQRDLDGWTPLHWAARRGDSNAVSLLLTHGASPFLITEDEKRGPLHLAALSNSALCVEQLLSYRKGDEVLKIDLKDVYGCTPLKVCAQENKAATTACLVKAHADINGGQYHGETPLCSAVSENSKDSATILLRAGADVTIRTEAGNSILHLAANMGDVAMLKLLTKARMRGLDVDARNSDGQTAEDKADLRDEAPAGFKKAFDNLLQSVVDEEMETGSWATSTPSMAESFHSFEEMSWYEAELIAGEDVLEAVTAAGADESALQPLLEARSST